jgi:serine/threonine-protein kinase
VLAERFATDAQWVARFEQEARLLASLNHPHIAQICGFEDLAVSGSDGVHVRALVMELVEGQTLAARIAAGPLPVEEVALIAVQVAEALESGFERFLRGVRPQPDRHGPLEGGRYVQNEKAS